MDLKTRIVDELTAVRARSFDLLDPLDPDALTRQHSPLMSPLVWDLAHVGNYEELWLLRAVGGRRRRRRSSTTPTTPSATPAGTAPALAAPRPGRGPRATSREVRGQVLDRLDAHRPRRCRTPAAGRLRVRHGRAARAPARRDDAGHAASCSMATAGATGRPPAAPPAARCGAVPDEVLGGGRARSSWARPTSRGPTTTSGPRHVVDVAAVLDRHRAGHERRSYARLRRRRRLRRRARWWTPDGLGVAPARPGLEHPQFWRRDGDGDWSALRFGSARRARRPRTSRCSTCAGTRPTPTPAGRASGCPPRPSGRRRRVGPGRGRHAATRGATAPPTPTRANLGQRHFGPAPVGAYPAGRSA